MWILLVVAEKETQNKTDADPDFNNLRIGVAMIKHVEKPQCNLKYK